MENTPTFESKVTNNVDAAVMNILMNILYNMPGKGFLRSEDDDDDEDSVIYRRYYRVYLVVVYRTELI